jgi:hypothetical protein
LWRLRDLTADEKKSAYRTLETTALGRLLEDGHLWEVARMPCFAVD